MAFPALSSERAMFILNIPTYQTSPTASPYAGKLRMGRGEVALGCPKIVRSSLHDDSNSLRFSILAATPLLAGFHSYKKSLSA